MVLGRNDKRKRKEGDLVDLMDPLSEAPKRAKVHAQRKFAQGAATIFSPTQTVIKEKEKPKPVKVTELIPNKRPNTEDFLTFLCFRGTSILPPSLNFFNIGSKKEKLESKSSAGRKAANNSNSTPSTSSGVSKVESNQSAVSKVKSADTVKKKVAPAIPKTVSVKKFKTATSTVQALKKKYQEQRLAKQRIGNKLKVSCVMRTRSATGRAIIKSSSKIPTRKFVTRTETKKHCLRSNTVIEKRKLPSPKTKILPKQKKKIIVKEQSSESSSSESSSEDSKSSPSIKRPIKTTKKSVVTRSTKTELRRVTRSRSEITPAIQTSTRPSRKTKEAATVYMEILSRKLTSPDLEIDDNESLDSFPELPNTRRNTSTENEGKAKGKAKGKANKDKDNKTEKSKNEKPVSKTKKPVKVQKYLDSDDESVSSEESNNTRPVTRRNSMPSTSNNYKTPSSSRSLRSSARNSSQKIDLQPKPTQSKKVVEVKKKNEQVPKKSSTVEKTPVKDKKSKINESQDSDDEPLIKLKKKKETIEVKEELPKDSKSKAKVSSSSGRSNKYDSTKISDDEESFHGFSKKAIYKVLNSCTSHMSANLIASEEARGSPNMLKTKETLPKGASTPKENNYLKPEVLQLPEIIKSETKDVLSPNNLILHPVVSSSPMPSLPESDKKCIHTPDDSSAILDIPLSTSLGRKERVNMSTEQIEKWLNESSMAKEESKQEMETVTNFSYEVVPEKPSKSDISHLSIPTRIQHLVRPVNVAIAKMAEKPSNKGLGILIKSPSALMGTGIALAKPLSIPTNRNKINADIKEIIKGRIAKTGVPCVVNKETIIAEDSDISSRTDGNASTDGFSPDKKLSSPDKKTAIQQKKSFLPKVKERKSTAPSVNAFSPENERSVYAFESDTEAPVNTPFRRKLRDSKSGTSSDIAESDDGNVKTPTKSSEKDDNSSSTPKSKATSHEGESSSKTNETIFNTPIPRTKFQVPEGFGNLSNVQLLPLGKLPNVWNSLNCSTSIAVQVNFDEQAQESQMNNESDEMNEQKCTEISTQTECANENEDDNDSHVFYIPLQGVSRNGPNNAQGQQLIQGVAVKLGTEGPNGPNQRVLLRAHLVTKPPTSVARCPPVGTVQPTTRTPSTSTSEPGPSTSTSTSTSPILPAPITIPSPRNLDKTAKQNPSPSASTEKVQKSPKAPRERKTSVDSSKMGKRGGKKKAVEIPLDSSAFPSMDLDKGEARLVEAPTFHPSEKDFQDPLEYIDKIRPIAEKFGICRVVPPSNFKPECKVSDDMRFTAYNQYIHRMLHRWGPNVKEMMAIKKYLATQSITLNQPPWIGGMEVDLPHLYQTVQSLGGLKEVIEKKKWQKVADGMKIPKSAQDRVTKLDDIYCKYLLPYDTLSTDERQKLFDDVDEEWKKRESKALQRLNAPSSDNEEEDSDDSSEEIEECIVKGRNMPLNAFYRIARNTQRMWFGESQRGNESEGASATEVENGFWKHVAERKRHVCVHAASIDSSGRGFGFSVAKNSPFARHPWNLKVLTNNNGSVLRALGPLMGVTVPTLHVGMLFSACCWYRDPHGLPWIEYLHTGAKKIWYGIPNEHNDNFREALSKMVPRFCKNKTIWLPSDTAMVPPETLVSNGVPLCQTVQEPGQFIIVFPKAFTSSICTGYVVSESVYFAQTTWLEHAEQIFKDLQDSCEPSMFSFERLLFSIINDSRSHVDVLKQILPAVTKIRDRELNFRQQLEYYGLNNKEKLPLPDSGKRKKGQKVKEEESDYECETCRMNLFISLVSNSQDDSAYCLPHALQFIARKKQVLKSCTFKYSFSEEELDDLIHKLEDRIEAKSKKTNQTRQTK